MRRETIAGKATVSLVCETFALSRAAFYAEARRQRGAHVGAPTKVVALPKAPRFTSAEVVLLRIQEVLAREACAAWGVRKVWATLKREGLKVSRKRVHAIMRAHGLVLAREREPGQPPRGHVVVPEPNRRLATDLTTVWTRRDGVVALVPTIDCGDRTVVIEVTKDQHGPAVLASVEAKLTAAFGTPTNVPEGVELRTDHGRRGLRGALHALAPRAHVCPRRPSDRERRRRALHPHAQGGTHLAPRLDQRRRAARCDRNVARPLPPPPATSGPQLADACRASRRATRSARARCIDQKNSCSRIT